MKKQSYHHKKDINNKKAKKEKNEEVPESGLGEIPLASATNSLNAFINNYSFLQIVHRYQFASKNFFSIIKKRLGFR